MLNTLRTGSTNIIVKGVLVLIALSFVSWGVGDMFTSQPDKATVATVGRDTSIRQAELDQAVRQEIAKLQQQFKSNFTEEQLKALNIETMVLNQIINRKLMEKATKSLDLQVGNEAIISHIRANPSFHNEQGQFDKSQYNNLLRSNNINEAAYINILKNEIATNFLFGTLISQQPVPDQLISLIHNYKNEQRHVDVLTIPHNIVKDVAEPTAAEITSYYESHKAEYTAPEYRSLSYFSLSSNDVLKQVAVSDGEMRTEFTNNPADYQKPETRDVENLIFLDEAQAKAAFESLSKSGNYARGIKSFADKGNKYNLLRAVSKAELPEEVKESVFSLEKGKISAPIKSSFGWHILHVTAINAPADASFEAHRDAIQKKLTLQKAESALYTVANKLEDDFASGSTLEEVATKYGLKTSAISDIDAKGENSEGKKQALLMNADNFLSVAFATDSGTISPLTLTPDKSSYFIVRVDKTIPARPKTLDEVRPLVILAQQALKQGEASKKHATELQQKLKSGAKIADLASSLKLPLASNQSVNRPSKVIYGRENSAYPNSLVEDVFALKPGEISKVHQANTGDYLIAQLSSIVVADAKDKAAKDEVRSEITDRIANDLSDQYLTYLRHQFPVTVTLPQPTGKVAE